MPHRLLRLLAALTLILLSCPAWAHAILEESTPRIGASIAQGGLDVRLRFNSRIDRGRSRLTLIKADRAQSPIAIAPDGPADIISAHLDLLPGSYTLRWQVLAVDGHITRGDVPFSVTGR